MSKQPGVRTRMTSWVTGYVSENRAWLQRMFVTSVAVTVAWLLGSELESDPLVASILTMVTLRKSLHASLNEGFSQVLGAAAGVSVAFLSIAVLGQGAPSVAVTIAACLLAARVLRLGDDGGIAISITALIVLGPGLPEDAALTRLGGTFLGVAVALVFSYWAHPSTPTGRTQALIGDLANDTADLLSSMSAGVLNGYTVDDAAGWLLSAREVSARVDAARLQAEESLRYSRWSPLASRDEAQSVYNRFIAVDHSIVQVRTIARSYFDAATKGISNDPSFDSVVAHAIGLAGEAMTMSGEMVNNNPAASLKPSMIAEMRETTAEAVSMLPSSTEAEELLLGASVMSNLERITDSLGLDSPAIDEVSTPLITASPVDAVVAAVKAPGRSVKRMRSKKKNRTRK